MGVWGRPFAGIGARGLSGTATGTTGVAVMDPAEAAGASPKPFYSALERAVRGLKQRQAPADQWLNQLYQPERQAPRVVKDPEYLPYPYKQTYTVPEHSPLPGVKPEELEWTGTKRFLEERLKQPVTRDELLAHVEANRVLPEEKLLGGSEEVIDPYSRMPGEPGAIEPGTSGPAKYAEYQLPGGENYRNLLLTLPKRTSAQEQRLDTVNGRLDEISQMRASYHAEHPELVAEFDTLNAERRQLMASEYRNPSFTSSHWDDPNVLAAVRFNDRAGPNGEKLLHIEELQSDWHQKGRKIGYKTDQEPARRHELETISNQRDFTPEEQVDWDRIADVGNHRPGSEAVPDAPLKNTWHEMAFRRMVKYAVDNGYDGITWTTGAQQVDRYNQALRQAVDEVRWEKTPKGVHLIGYKDNALKDVR